MNEYDGETFTAEQVQNAIRKFLEYGNDTFMSDGRVPEKLGHYGYFSGQGWAARCLRWHLQQLANSAGSPSQGAMK